ncbi:MAG: YhdH/YhfP family quinone oxidoreductase [Desulfobacterales bacterium]|nr:YhdH/YhfP family quinone oxidoreductase [Desulfobacterales bacterium]
MEDKGFKALVISETEDKQYTREILQKTVDDLPSGDVVVQVHYSSLNYKDALSASGNKGVTRNYPHTPGIDAAGVVAESADSAFKPGDEVIVTSYDLGMNTAGGFGQYIRVPAQWVVPLPGGLGLKEAMCYGTAGFTAGLSVFKLIDHGVLPEHGEVLVSGATGGVGGIAVAILSKLGYPVVAVNGLVDEAAYLESIGAQRVISIEEAADQSGRPLLKSQWAGSIDTVGGDILATSIKSVNPHGVVTSCGNVASPELPINVFPFILRGVTLVGIDSQNCPMPDRLKTWEKLAGEWKIPTMETVVEEIGLADLDGCIDRMLKGQHKGRAVVNMTT